MNNSSHRKRQLLISVAVFGFALLGRGAEEIGSLADSPLAPIAFLTTHEWEAQLPNTPDGKKMSIHARFTWTENRQAIRISNEFITDGKPRPYVEGLYSWNPQKRAIVFVYVDGDGNFYDGTVRIENGKLLHECEEFQKDGKTESILARVTPHGSESWDNEIFIRKNGALTPIVQVKYTPVR